MLSRFQIAAVRCFHGVNSAGKSVHPPHYKAQRQVRRAGSTMHLALAVITFLSFCPADVAWAGKPSGKLPGNIPARITFDDANGDAIRSDGLGDLWLEPKSSTYTNTSGREKVKVEIVLGGHLDFTTGGSARADEMGIGRTVFAYFDPVNCRDDRDNFNLDENGEQDGRVTLTTLSEPYTLASTCPADAANEPLLPAGTITEIKMTVGAWRFGDQEDGVANKDTDDEQSYFHEFDLRTMQVQDDPETPVNERIRHDVNLTLMIFFYLPNRTSTNLVLFFDPAGVDRSRPGSNFVTVECLEQEVMDPEDGPSGPAVKWKISTCHPDYVFAHFPQAAVYEGGGGEILKGYWEFPFEATLECLLP